MERQKMRQYFPVSLNDESHCLIPADDDADDVDDDVGYGDRLGGRDHCAAVDYDAAAEEVAVADAVVANAVGFDADESYNPTDLGGYRRVLSHVPNKVASKILHRFDCRTVRLAT